MIFIDLRLIYNHVIKFGFFKFGAGAPEKCPGFLKFNFAELYLAWAPENSSLEFSNWISLFFISFGRFRLPSTSDDDGKHTNTTKNKYGNKLFATKPNKNAKEFSNNGGFQFRPGIPNSNFATLNFAGAAFESAQDSSF